VIEMRCRAGWMMVLVVGVAASLALTACSGSDADGEGAGGSGGAEPAPANEREDGLSFEADSDLRQADSSGGSSGPAGLGSLQVDLSAEDSVFGSPKVTK
jgi:hypothetical protein